MSSSAQAGRRAGLRRPERGAALVEFALEAIPGGTKLTVVETGFDSLPVHRRADALKMNEQGWAQQLDNIDRHVRAQS